MKNEIIFEVRGCTQNDERILGTYTTNPAVAMEEFLNYTILDTKVVRIEDVNTGEIYAEFYCKNDNWGIQIKRSVSHEFTDMLVSASLQR